MPIALALPFAEAAGIAVAGLSAAAIADKVNEYIKLNPEDSMMILKMINPASAGEGLSTLFKKKAKTEKEKEPSIEDLEEIGEDLSQADKAKVMKAYGKSKGAGKRQRMIDIAKKLGLAGEGKERQKTFDEVEGRYEDSDFEEERTKPKFDYTKFFKANGGRINYEEGGIINSLQNIIGQGLEYGSDAGRFILGAASGIPGIGLGITALQNLSNKTFSNLPIGDQLFITEQMGTTDDNKDAYGYNIRSMFGNYGDLVTRRAQMAAERQRKGLEQRAIDEYYTRLEIERQAAEDEARRRAITTANQNIDYGGFVSGGGTHSSDSSFTGHSSATGGGMGQSGWGGPRAKGGFIGKYAQGGRVNYQAGGVATPEQYAAALAKVGAGTEADKRRSLGNYIGDYISTQGQKIGNAAVIPLQAAKGVLGIQGTPMTSSMESALQNIIQNQISKTGNLSGNINYKDYGVQTSTGAEFEGFGNRSITDPEAALATTLGQASYSVDPGTGKVTFTGGTTYDFRDDQFGGLGRFISKGGLFNQLPSPSNNFQAGATQYNPNISLSSEFLKPYQPADVMPRSDLNSFTPNEIIYDNQGRRLVSDSMVNNIFNNETYNNEQLKAAFGDNITFVGDDYYQNQLNSQSNNLIPFFENYGTNAYRDTRDGSVYSSDVYNTIKSGNEPSYFNIYNPYSLPVYSPPASLKEGGLATMFVEKR